MDYEPDCFYQLQGRTDEHSWRVVGSPFLYCDLQAAKADAHLLLARYPDVTRTPALWSNLAGANVANGAGTT